MAGLVLVNLHGMVSKFETNEVTKKKNHYERMGYRVAVMRSYDKNNVVHELRRKAIERELLNEGS